MTLKHIHMYIGVTWSITEHIAANCWLSQTIHWPSHYQSSEQIYPGFDARFKKTLMTAKDCLTLGALAAHWTPTGKFWCLVLVVDNSWTRLGSTIFLASFAFSPASNPHWVSLVGCWFSHQQLNRLYWIPFY